MTASLHMGDTVRLLPDLCVGNVYLVVCVAPAPAGAVCLLRLISYISDEPEGSWNPPYEFSLVPAESLEAVAYDPEDILFEVEWPTSPHGSEVG